MSARLPMRSLSAFGDRLGLPRKTRLAGVAGAVAFALLAAGALVGLPQAGVDSVGAATLSPNILAASQISGVNLKTALAAETCARRSWPYMDQRCVSSEAENHGQVRTVRLVNTDGITATTIVTPRPAGVATAARADFPRETVASFAPAMNGIILGSDLVAPAKAASAQAAAAPVAAPQKHVAKLGAEKTRTTRRARVAANPRQGQYGRNQVATRSVSDDGAVGLAYTAEPLKLLPF